MKTAIMQPYIFPYIGYFQLINAVDTFVFLDDVNYINKGWINRNYIQHRGNKLLFTIPLMNASQNELINNIAVLNDGKWQKKLFISFEHAYKKSPHYEDRIGLLKQVFDFDKITIGELAKKSILAIAKELNFKTTFIDSSSVFNNQQLRGEERIIDIVKKSGGTHYINPTGGQELYNKEKFAGENLLLNFIQTGEVKYKQHGEDFVPFLSMIDLLMYNSNEEITNFLSEYTLL